MWSLLPELFFNFGRFELILNLLFLQIVVNTVTYCFYVWLVTEILRWVIGWAFFREQSMNIVHVIAVESSIFLTSL